MGELAKLKGLNAELSCIYDSLVKVTVNYVPCLSDEEWLVMADITRSILRINAELEDRINKAKQYEPNKRNIQHRLR